MNEKLEQIIREVECRHLNVDRTVITTKMKNDLGETIDVRYQFSSIPECEFIFVQITSVYRIPSGFKADTTRLTTTPILHGGLIPSDYEELIDDAYLEFGAVKKEINSRRLFKYACQDWLRDHIKMVETAGWELLKTSAY